MQQTTEKNEVIKKTSIGGQALIEGIMMRGPEHTAMAVRHVSGEIVLDSWPTGGKTRAKVFRLPFVRGIFNMVDSLRYGYKCLMRSAEMAGLEEEEPAAAAPARDGAVPSAVSTAAQAPADAVQAGVPEEALPPMEEAAQYPAEATVTAPTASPADELPQEPTAEESAPPMPAQEPAVPGETAGQAPAPVPAAGPDAAQPSKKEQFLMSLLMVFSSILGVALAIFLFLWLPATLSRLLGEQFPVMKSWVLKSVFEGVLRIVLFVGYISLVSLMKDIRRVFMYHGAEHKTIFCYEKGLDLTVENVRGQVRFHPRCGTSFMILILLVGILVSMFIHIESPLLRTGIKLLTIPIVVGVGYELIKLAGRRDNWFTRIISAPGLWLQRITTKEPDDGMIECAIAALRKVVPDDPDADRW